MTHTVARGLPADWLNAWLAAIGVLVLADEVSLSWTAEPRPRATFHHTTPDLAALIVQSLPTRAETDHLAIARVFPGHSGSFDRRVPVEVFAERATVARARGDATLGSCVTDLQVPRKGELDHSPLDPPAPKGVTMWDRIVACQEQLGDDPTPRVSATLQGRARRAKLNGLGFDHTRFLTPSDPVGDVWVDPVVELLVAAGMTLMHSRGDGRHPAHRGWTGPGLRPGAFSWPVWKAPLSLPAIDAVLDLWWADTPAPKMLGSYESVPYQPRATMDQTRGYASRAIRPAARR